MDYLDRLLFCTSGGQFREFCGVTTDLEPRDLSLYRRLLPRPVSIAGVVALRMLSMTPHHAVQWKPIGRNFVLERVPGQATTTRRARHWQTDRDPCGQSRYVPANRKANESRVDNSEYPV